MNTTTQTETIPDFQVAETPHTDMTLAELHRLKTRWLDMSLETGLLTDCYNVVKEFGRRVEAEFRHPWNYIPIYRWQAGQTKIELYEHTGKYMLGIGEYEIREHLLVFVDGKKLADYTFTNNKRLDTSAFFFVPGRWTLAIQAKGQEANKSIQNNVLQAQENERQELLETLQIGVEL